MQAANNLVEQSQASRPPVDPQRPFPGWLSALYAAVDAFDVDTFLTFLSPQCELRFGNAPAVYGHEAIGAAIGGLFGAIKGISHTNMEAWVNPDATICSGQVTYVRKDDSELSVPFAVIFRLENKLVRQYLIFVDNSQLFA